MLSSLNELLVVESVVLLVSEELLVVEAVVVLASDLSCEYVLVLTVSSVSSAWLLSLSSRKTFRDMMIHWYIFRQNPMNIKILGGKNL